MAQIEAARPKVALNVRISILMRKDAMKKGENHELYNYLTQYKIQSNSEELKLNIDFRIIEKVIEESQIHI